MTFHIYVMWDRDTPLALTPVEGWVRALRIVHWARKHGHNLHMVVFSKHLVVMRQKSNVWD